MSEVQSSTSKADEKNNSLTDCPENVPSKKPCARKRKSRAEPRWLVYECLKRPKK